MKNLFAIVRPKKPIELCLEEFIRFSFDLKANKSNSIKSIEILFRVQRDDKENKKTLQRLDT